MKNPAFEVTKSQYELLAALRHAWLRFLHFSRGAAGQAGLTPQQHQALLAIKGCPGRDYLAVGELARSLHLRPHSAVELIDRLVARQLVRREAARLDRRRVEVRLTSRGERLIRRLSETHLAELREHGPELHRLLGSILKS